LTADLRPDSLTLAGMFDDSSASAFESFTEHEQAEILEHLKAQVERARAEPAAFVETCARAEHTQEPIELASHQHLLLAFVQRYRLCVVRMPVGTSKTFLLTFLGMWLLGRDRTARGAIASAGQIQAKKPLSLIRQYIEDDSLAAVFPELQPSQDPHDPWRDAAIVIDRPRGIRDPSCIAIGVTGKPHGARLSWILADDILDRDNTLTKEARDKVDSDFEAGFLSRLDPLTGRCVVTNTPWDRDDITYRLSGRGWPAVSMSITGEIWFENVADPLKEFGELIRPSRRTPGRFRLRAHDPDDLEVVPLWPEKQPIEYIEQLRGRDGMGVTPFNFARFRLCEPYDAEHARCLREWVDDAFLMGTGQVFPAERTHGCPTFTGVDIGGIDKHHDLSSILTFELLADGRRRILNLQSGHWNGSELIRRIVREAKRYDSTVHVESNNAQRFIAEFAQKQDLSARIVRFDTNKKNKYDETFGVEAVFTEMNNKLWIWPDGGADESSKELETLGDDCVAYDPNKHTPDRLMALFLARQGLSRYRSREARKGQAGAQKRAFIGGGM
jgi:hypothetical protein